MTRVVHVVVAGEIGGAERMLVDLASSAPDTHSIALLTPNPALARLFTSAGLRVHDGGRVREGPLPYLRQSLGSREVAWVSSVLAKERAEVAHLHTFASQVIGARAALRAGARIVRTEHSTRAFDDPTCWPFSRWSLRRADACAAISDHVRGRALVRASWAASKMIVIYNGVDHRRFAPVEVDRPSFRFAVAGRLEPRKGVDLAIHALAQVPDAHLDVVGDGPDRVRLWKLAVSRGVSRQVVFHGYLPDPRPILARASAVLCPSRTEGLGLSVLEAMAMGRPVVAFAVGGVPELVEDGRTGLLARAGDVQALAARMREAMAAGDRLEEWGHAGRARAVDRFSVSAMCQAYEALYTTPLDGVSRR
jgi:glycosyltransferase involved in cell wall biosynthesis